MADKLRRELTLGNIYDKNDCLCEGCQEAIIEGFDTLILCWDILYHVKCWEKKCNEW